jgi:hypothetical protein
VQKYIIFIRKRNNNSTKVSTFFPLLWLFVSLCLKVGFGCRIFTQKVDAKMGEICCKNGLKLMWKYS